MIKAQVYCAKLELYFHIELAEISLPSFKTSQGLCYLYHSLTYIACVYVDISHLNFSLDLYFLESVLSCVFGQATYIRMRLVILFHCNHSVDPHHPNSSGDLSTARLHLQIVLTHVF